MKGRKTRLTRLALLMAVAAGAPTAAHALDKVKVIEAENAFPTLAFLSGRDAGVFRKHGIDVEVDVRPFAGFLAGFPSKSCMTTTYSGLGAVADMNHGMDIAIIGGGLTVFQQIFVPAGSPIKTVEDLRGKRVGVWSTGAASFKAIRAALIESNGLDLVKDTKIAQMAAPALFKLSAQGKFDAMINISSFTIKAASQPDKFRSIYSADEYWKKKTGYPIILSSSLVAWKSWINENPDRAKRFAAAVAESFRRLKDPDNLRKAVEAHGKIAGITDPKDVETYAKWLSAGKVFFMEWNKKIADAQWQFLALAKKYGILDKVPSEKEHALFLGD